MSGYRLHDTAARLTVAPAAQAGSALDTAGLSHQA